MGRSWQDEVYLESGDGDSPDVHPTVRRVPEDAGGHRVSRLHDTERMADSMGERHDSHG